MNPFDSSKFTQSLDIYKVAKAIKTGSKAVADAVVAASDEVLKSILRDMGKSVDNLVNALPKQFGPVIRSACAENLLLYPLPLRSKIKFNEQPHYTGPSSIEICDGKYKELVFAEMLSNGSNSAPTFNEESIKTGQIETLWPAHDMIVKLVDDEKFTIYNVTLPKHVFFPGYVKLVVTENEKSTFVEVSGYGTGNLKDFNTYFGPVLFYGIVKGDLRSRVKERLDRKPNL